MFPKGGAARDGWVKGGRGKVIGRKGNGREGKGREGRKGWRKTRNDRKRERKEGLPYHESHKSCLLTTSTHVSLCQRRPSWHPRVKERVGAYSVGLPADLQFVNIRVVMGTIFLSSPGPRAERGGGRGRGRTISVVK